MYAWAAGKKKEEDLPAQMANWINVHNGESETILGNVIGETDIVAVAEAHVLALETPDAAGERFITSMGPYAGQDVCDVSWRLFRSIRGVPSHL